MKSLICLAILIGVAQNALAASWTYQGAKGPEYWKTLGECNGTRQSPIDIIIPDVVTTDLGPFELVGYESRNDFMDFDNNGHSVTVRLADDEEHLYQVSGGGLPKDYVGTQFHIHWGSNNSQGSEHLINGEAYPAELHMVHYSPEYTDLVQALISGNFDAVTVLGFFMEIAPNNNNALDSFLDHLEAIKNWTDPSVGLGKGNLPSFSVRSIMPFDLSSFYRYNGSLTVPNCYETVIWTMFEETIKISQAQLNKLRLVLGDTTDDLGNALPIVDNYRTTNPVYERTVYYSTPGGAEPSPNDGNNDDDDGDDDDDENDASAIHPTHAIVLIVSALSMVYARM